MTMASTDDDDVLLSAYHDGELEPAARRALELRLQSDSALRQQFDRLKALSGALARGLDKDVAPDRLRERIARIGNAPATPHSVRSHRFDWRAMAASAVIAAGFASSLTYVAVAPETSAVASQAIVAVHQRALLAASPVDVASSDRHTVKPWFDAKLALSPSVIDLAADGYPLLGGRIDTIDGHAVPDTIYQRGKHLISVIAVPLPGSRDTGGAVTRQSRDGYTALTWRGVDFSYSAVSDVADGDLDTFVSKLRMAIVK